MNYKISKINAREILDSRGNPTVEAEVILGCGVSAKASVPSGASIGEHEAIELRDNNKKRYAGMGVLKACENINTKISRKLKNINIFDQQEIDSLLINLDNSQNKKNLGANAMLGVSLACCRAGAMVEGLDLYNYIQKIYKLDNSKNLPIPMFNVFNGGKHADTNLDIQEIMLVPFGIEGFSEQVRAGSEIFHVLASVLHEHGLDTDVGNEGGYAPNINSTMQAFDMILTAINRAGYKAGEQIGLAVDIGASELYDSEKRFYTFDLDDNYLIGDQLVSLYRDWADYYPIFSIEDGLSQDDWENWEQLVKEFERYKTSALKQKMMIVGDDLTVTNTERLEAAIKRKACNAVILKPNQIGTLSESIEFAKMAKKADIKIITSHRSGETCDNFIVDLAVAICSDFVKFGSLSRGERVSKYNRLMEIEQNLKNL
ncbi:MAG: phosphopyruvate hydratase [Patescibacteria group bacterium]